MCTVVLQCGILFIVLQTEVSLCKELLPSKFMSVEVLGRRQYDKPSSMIDIRSNDDT